MVKHLDAVVAGVGDGNPAARPVKVDRARAVELSGSIAERPKPVGGGAVDLEHLDAVVAGVGDGNHMIAGDGDACRR